MKKMKFSTLQVKIKNHARVTAWWRLRSRAAGRKQRWRYQASCDRDKCQLADKSWTRQREWRVCGSDRVFPRRPWEHLRCRRCTTSPTPRPPRKSDPRTTSGASSLCRSRCTPCYLDGSGRSCTLDSSLSSRSFCPNQLRGTCLNVPIYSLISKYVSRAYRPFQCRRFQGQTDGLDEMGKGQGDREPDQGHVVQATAANLDELRMYRNLLDGNAYRRIGAVGRIVRVVLG